MITVEVTNEHLIFVSNHMFGSTANIKVIYW